MKGDRVVDPNFEVKPVAPALAEHAEEIRMLGKRVKGDVIKIGRLLTEAQKMCGRGNWRPWLEREFGWTDRHARNLMGVYALSLKSEKFSDLEIPDSGLYLLAAPSTPTKAVDEVIERAERLAHAEIKRVIDVAKVVQREKTDDAAATVDEEEAPDQDPPEIEPEPDEEKSEIEPRLEEKIDRLQAEIEVGDEEINRLWDEIGFWRNEFAPFVIEREKKNFKVIRKDRAAWESLRDRAKEILAGISERNASP
jgi:hypothetical protein